MSRDFFSINVTVHNSGLGAVEQERIADGIEKMVSADVKYPAKAKASRIVAGTSCICKDCSRDCIMFALRDELWKIIAPDDRKCILCLRCAEMRLGRHIVVSDLKTDCGWYKEFSQCVAIWEQSQ